MSEKECPFCKGEKFINSGYKEEIINGHRSLYPYATPCYCEINKNILNKFGLFGGTPAAIPEDSKKIRELINNAENYIFFGREEAFLYITRSYFLKDFYCKDYMVLEGSRLVEIYQVPDQSKKTWLTITPLNQYDLVILLFTSSTRYENSMKPSILELIKNRSRINKPTWVFSRSPESLKNSHEYSSDLDYYFDNYKKVPVDKFKNIKGLSLLKGMSNKNESSIQSNLGNI